MPTSASELLSKLTYKNGLNALAVLVHILSNINYDAMGPGGMEWLNSIREFGKFNTIVTPVDATFYVRIIILYLNTTFGIVQLLPKYSQGEIVQEGISYWFALAAGLQVISTIFFSFESLVGFFISTIMLGGMVACIMKILLNHSSGRVRETEHSPEEYWLLRFPFSVQFGWYLCILISSINNIFVRFGASPLFQIILAIICFIAYGAIAAKMLVFNGENPNYVVPSVIAIFTFGIACDFQGPGIEDDFGGGVVIFLIFLASVLSIGTAVATGYLLYTKEFKSDDDGDIDTDYRGSEMTTTNSTAPTDAAVSAPEPTTAAVV